MQAREILDKVDRGDMSVSQACSLLGRLEEPGEKNPPRARWIRVRVEDEDGSRLRLRLPMFLVGLILNLAALAIRLIPEKRFQEWMSENGDSSLNEGTMPLPQKRQLLAALSEIRRSGARGSGLEVNDGESHVILRLE